IENVLSPQEADIICGAYQVFHGMSAPKRHATHLSWWPKPAVWAISGLDVGYWSSECESWYRERIMQINESTAGLRTSDQWK
ncbi:hypothetical protein M422DRAFT_135541, partial [Sphaerobolus stellatus SS14]